MITEHFTSTERNPVREIAEAARTGPATTVLAGISVGLESSVWAIMAIVDRDLGVDRHLLRIGARQHRAHALPGRTDGHGPPGDDRHGRLRGQLRSGVGQLGRYRRDGRRVRWRGRARHGQPRRRRQHDQGHHQGCRDRIRRHRDGRVVRKLHRDDRQPAEPREDRLHCSSTTQRLRSTSPTRRRSSAS